MKKNLCLIPFFLISLIGYSQIFKEITTQDGGKIILYNNHTWEYKAEPLSNYLPTSNFPDVTIEKTGFTIGYNKEMKQARWVAYELTRDEVNSKIAARNDKFIPDNKNTSATDKDYLKSGYDRGHLAPAADMGYSLQAMEECFSYTNISPQNPILNRGIWKQLEDKVRDWAIEDSNIYIVTGGVLQPNLSQLGKNKVAVPNYFYKIILDLNPPCKAIAFVIPNGSFNEPLANYVTTIDNVEKITDIDFFPQIPDYMENELESKSSATTWGLVTTTANTNNTTENANLNNSGQQTTPNEAAKITTTSNQRCQAITQAGNQCSRTAQIGSKYCWQHQGYVGTDSNSKNNVSSNFGTTKSTGNTSSGRTILTGPRGGKYYINKNGNKTYVK